MFIAKQFVLPAAPAFPAPAIAAAPAAIPSAATVAAGKVARAARAANSGRAQTALRAGLQGLGCACRRRAAIARKAGGMGALGFSFTQLLESAGIGAGVDAITQLVQRQPKTSVSTSMTPINPSTGVPFPTQTLTPAGSPPPAPAGYQYNAAGQLVPSSGSTTPNGTPAPQSQSWFSQQTLISGISNGAVVGIAGGGLLLVAMMMKRRR